MVQSFAFVEVVDNDQVASLVFIIRREASLDTRVEKVIVIVEEFSHLRFIEQPQSPLRRNTLNDGSRHTKVQPDGLAA